MTTSRHEGKRPQNKISPIIIWTSKMYRNVRILHTLNLTHKHIHISFIATYDVVRTKIVLSIRPWYTTLHALHKGNLRRADAMGFFPARCEGAENKASLAWRRANRKIVSGRERRFSYHPTPTEAWVAGWGPVKITNLVWSDWTSGELCHMSLPELLYC